MSAAATGPTGAPLGHLLRRGAALSTIGVGSVQVVSLLATLVLARLLTPEEVGVYAAATLLTYFFVSFADGGLREALVQREDDTADVVDTVFWATAAGGLLMSVGALAAAPVVGLLFGSDLVATIAAITAGMLLVEALTNVPNGLMQRRFDLRRKLVADPVRALVFAGVTIALAATGHGVWALVVGNYAAVLAWSATSWALAGWRPGLGRFSVRLWREMARFAAPLLLRSLAAYLRATVESALVGRQLGEGALGQYRYGSRLAALPTVAVVEVGAYLLLPAFSRVSKEPARFRSAFLRALRWMWFLAVPTAALVGLCGAQLVVVVLGEVWRGAGLLLVAMAGVAVGVALQAVAGEAVKASGRSRLLNRVSVAQLLAGVALLVALLPMGLVGVGLAVSLTEVGAGLLLLAVVRPIVGVTWRDLVRTLWPQTAAAALASSCVLALRLITAFLPVPLGLLVEVLAFSAAYLLVLAVLDRSSMTVLLRRIATRRVSPLRPDIERAHASDTGRDRS